MLFRSAARRAAVAAAPVSLTSAPSTPSIPSAPAGPSAPSSPVTPASPPAPPASTLNGARPASGTPRLPQRTRQASLSPHLRDSDEPDAAEPDAEPADDRSPEQARALAASLQTGWRRGRQSDPPTGAFPPSPRQDPTAANREEA